MKIKGKIIVSSSIGALISCVLTGVFFYLYLFEKVKEERVNYFHSQNTLYLQKYNDFIQHNKAILDQYALSEEFNSLVSRSFIIRELSFKPAEKLAKDIREKEKYIDDVYLLNNENRDIFKKKLGFNVQGFNPNNLQIDNGHLYLSHPLHDQRGILVIQIDLGHLKSAFDDVLPQCIEYFLLSKDLKVLFASSDFAMTDDIVYTDTLKDVETQGYFYCYTSLGGYIIGTKVSKMNLFRNIKSLLLIVTGLILFVTLLSMISSILISSSITKSVANLVGAIEKNKDGHYEKARVDGPDEIRFFAKKYNEMISRVSNFTQDLETKVKERTIELEEQKKKLKIISQTDKLTGAHNRIKLDELLEAEKQSTYSIILADIDDFKRVNDSYGHQVGDKVLVEFARVLKDNIRQTDSLVRWGGEEFMVICPNASLKASCLIADKLREKIAAHIFPDGLKLTASFGVGCGDENISQDKLFVAVDQALYKAKQGGKNRVECTDMAG